MSSLPIIEFVVSFVVPFVAIQLIGIVTKRIWPYLPDIFTDGLERVWIRYLNFWRKRTPDYLYRLWLRTGIMDGLVYRKFQEKGIISDDLDPKYIQKNQ